MKFKHFLYWQNRFKYFPLVQKAYLLKNLSSSFPATLNIEPTNNCNLQCTFCPIQTSKRERGFMDLTLFKKIMKEIPQKLVALWLHKDGEPLLHPQIAEMIKKAKEESKTSRIEIYTNGVLLTEEVVESLIRSKLDSLVISLDAFNEVEYQKLKGKNEYQKILKNINTFLETRKRLKSNLPILTIKTIEMDNKDNQEKFINFWRTKAENVVVQPMHEWEGSIEIQNSEFRIQNSKRYPCNLPWLSPAITWDGLVMPCCINYKENELVMGDLKKNNLVEIYRGTKYKELRKAHLSGNLKKFPTCQKCTFWKQLPDMGWYLGNIKK